MAMLAPSEFFAGSVRAAPVQGLSLIIPRSQYELRVLVAGFDGRKLVVFLNDPNQVDAFEWSEESESFEGMLVPGVAIELDAQSAFDPRGGGAVGGCLIREADTLKILAGASGNRYTRNQRFPLLGGLPPCAEQEAVGFRKWRIVIGVNDEKRELFAMALQAPPA